MKFWRPRHLSVQEALDLFAIAWRAAGSDDALPEISTFTSRMRECDRIPLTMAVAAWIAREVAHHEHPAGRAVGDNPRAARATPASGFLLSRA